MKCCDTYYWNRLDLDSLAVIPLSMNILNDKAVFNVLTQYKTKGKPTSSCSNREGGLSLPLLITRVFLLLLQKQGVLVCGLQHR